MKIKRNLKIQMPTHIENDPIVTGTPEEEPWADKMGCIIPIPFESSKYIDCGYVLT